jgi:hypothetical protein
MKIFFSPSGGFFSDILHGKNLPKDCIPISHAEYVDLLTARVIKIDDKGRPYSYEYQNSDQI